MHLRVHLAPYGSGPTKNEATIDMTFSGDQLVRWLATAAVDRFLELRGDPLNSQNPQSVMTRGGRILNADAVLSELLQDGDEVFVEFWPGPESFVGRWASRPATPEFDWEAGREIVPPHDDWLSSLDLVVEQVESILPEARDIAGGALSDDEVNGYDKSAELAKVRALLVQYAPVSQAICLYYSISQRPPTKQQPTSNLDMNGFRLLYQDAKLASEHFAPDAIERIYLAVVAQAKHRLLTNQPRNSSSGMDSEATVRELLLVLTHLAAEQCRVEPSLEVMPLAEALQRLWEQHVVRYLLPSLATKCQPLEPCLHADARAVVSKAVKMIEMLLQSCMYKRVHGASLSISLRHVLMHVARWGLVDRVGTGLGASCLVALGNGSDVMSFVLLDRSLPVNVAVFQRLLSSLTYAVYLHEQVDGDFAPFLSEFLDDLFKKSGVLADMARKRNVLDDV